MQQITLRFEDEDLEQARQRALVMKIPVAAHIRDVYVRDLRGIDAATILREEMDRIGAGLRLDNERFQSEVVEMLIALRDSLTTTNTEFHNDLVASIQSALPDKSTSVSQPAFPKPPTRNQENNQ